MWLRGIFLYGDVSVNACKNNEIDFAKKITYLLDHPEECAKLDKLGKERVENEFEGHHEEPKLLAAFEALFLAWL